MTSSTDLLYDRTTSAGLAGTGRSCPVGYRYAPQDIALSPARPVNVLYVIGGLYGNTEALNTILQLVQCETEPVALCFNGDFNWFNVSQDRFQHINTTVRQFDALRGNVETGLAQTEAPDDCGCAYPDFVDDGVVTRSNQIMSRLHQTALGFPDTQQWLAQLPRYLRYQIAGQTVSVVHGDPESLAGWGLCQEQLDQPQTRQKIKSWLADTESEVIASTHTCLPFLYREPAGTVVNNGASGMPGFFGDLTGLMSRIAVSPPPAELDSAYGVNSDRLYINAIRIPYAHDAWIKEFCHQWHVGSAAHLSYYDRLVGNIDYSIDQAVRWLV